MKEIGWIKKIITWFQALTGTQLAVGGAATALLVAGVIGGVALSDALDTSGKSNGTQQTEGTYATESLMPGIIEEETQVTEETEVTEEEVEINVRITTTSIERDLKIKIVDENGNLVKGFPFVVTVTSKDEEAGADYDDHDMDGIIHIKDLEGGKYKVLLQELEGIIIEKNEITADVKGKIEYQKVEIQNEVKDESEINVSIEDTANNNVTEEAPIVDTIKLVDSTVTTSVVSKEQVNVSMFPAAIVSAEWNEQILEQTKKEMGAGPQQPENSEIPEDTQKPENNETPEDTQKPESSETPEDTQKPESSETPEDTQKPESSETPEDTQKPGNDGTSENPEDNNTSVNPPQIEDDIQDDDDAEEGESVESEINGGSSLLRNNGFSYTTTGATHTVTVASAKVSIPKNVTLYTVGSDISKTAEILLKIEDANQLIQSYTWVVSDNTIADLLVAENQMSAILTAKAEGKTTIVVSFVYKSGVNGETNTCDLICEVNVVKSTDKETQLTDMEGNLLYLDKEAKTIATPADFEQAIEFYSSPKYTGWQTIDGYLYYFTENHEPATGKHIIGGVNYEFHEDGTLKENEQSVGIDVSKWQGKIDWETVANAGIDFAIIRCGYRGSSTGVIVEDPYFKDNIKGATENGIKVGVYFFTQAITEAEAVEEASTAISLVAGYKLNFPIYIDTEGSGGRADSLSKSDRTAIVKAFCETVRNSGYKPGIYASKYWYYDNLDTSQLSTYNIWVAQYNTECNYSGRYDMWQYTSSGSVPGINGNVDMNICYTKY